MKLYKSIMSLALMATMIVFSGCSTDGYWDAYTEEVPSFTFEQASLSYSLTPNDKLSEVNIKLIRSNTTGDIDVPVVVSNEGSAFATPTSVKFEDGKNTADLKVAVDLSEISIGTQSSVDIALDSKDVNVAVSGVQKTTLKISKNYTWVSAGSAQVYSQWVGNWDATGLVGKGIKVPIDKAVEGDGLYRLNSMYHYMEPDYAKKAGYHIEFTVDNSLKPVNLPKMQYIGESASGGGEYVLMYLTTGNYAGQFYMDGNMYVIETVIGKSTSAGVSLSAVESIAFVWNK